MEKNKIDTNFYSRQLGVYGIETMKKIRQLNILIYGMRGLGFEICKNIVLAGPNKVTLFDPNTANVNDLTSNFYLSIQDVKDKKRRDEAILEQMSKLNPSVVVNLMEGVDLYENILKNLNNHEKRYSVVIITEFLKRDEIIKINLLCRNNNIGFIYTTLLGIFGFCFVDFGDKFYIDDENGEDPLNYCIKSISNDKKGIIKIDTTTGILKLDDYSKVTFKEIEGMTELNNCSPINIKILTKDSIEIGDTSNYSKYISGGIMIEAKLKKELCFTSLDERFDVPYTNEEDIPRQIDYSKLNTNELIHIGILALNKFYQKNNFLPELNNKEHSIELIELGKEIYIQKKILKLKWLEGLEEEYEHFNEVLEKILSRLSLWAKAEISPLASFLGGISAQEIIKYTGKYNPIHQWKWFDFSEVVENLNDNIDRELKNCKYDDQIAIFGNKIQEKLENSNIFIIGAGALGCEYLKTFSLMGIAKRNNNKVIITDNDNIELSNLNRQFLYRNSDIGNSKSKVACNALNILNPEFNCYALEDKVCKETENIFNDNFWECQDYIINAVDNVEARIYISNQCLIYKKILIDSGTLGTRANSQVIVPYKTINYIGEKKKNIEQDRIAMCTLRNYPTLINHCIEWALDKFDGYFVKIIKSLKLFCENKNNYYDLLNKETSGDYDLQIKELEKIISYTNLLIKHNFDDCIEIAFNEYNDRYNNDIIQMLIDNPLDSKNEDGSKFWSVNKRAPIKLPFNDGDELIILYIKKYAQILAKSLSIKIIDDDEYIKNKCKSFKIKDFIPNKKESKIKTNRYLLPNEDKKLAKLKKIEAIKSRLKLKKENFERLKNIADKITFSNKNIFNTLKISEFEKDYDLNGHIEFLYAASNLRAKNFRIQNCDINKVKIIAGKITPAIATTTASIVGLAALQLYTLKQTENIDFLRDCNMNLSYNNYMFIKPIKCKSEKDLNTSNNTNYIYIPEHFTIWDFFEIKQSMNVGELLDFFLNKYKVNITSINADNINLYEKRRNSGIFIKKIEDIYNEISKQKLIESKKFLILYVYGMKDNFEVKMPKIKYIFK